MAHYIFGYGSLISSESRNKTGATNEAWPVRMSGVQRGWNLVVPHFCMSAVGAYRKDGATCNGVLVSVLEQEFPKFDEQEIPYGYVRNEVNPYDVEFLKEGELTGKDTAWIYTTSNPGTPTQEAPIVQSYVDVILDGCMEFGLDFAKEFIITTKGWEMPWVNDRKNPRYPRASAFSHDRLLLIEGTLQALVINRRIE